MMRPGPEHGPIYLYRQPVDKRNYVELIVMPGENVKPHEYV